MAKGDAAGKPARRERLAQRRKALGLTQEQLAELLQVGRTTVARWERGETEPLPWLQPRLAEVLRLRGDRIEELLGAEGSPTRPEGPGAIVPHQLPPAVADFMGRASELAALSGLLDRVGSGPPGTVVVGAIGGTAGVGKTALAIHFAHQVAARFVNGQLYVDLRGFAPSGAPVTPEEAIRGFLVALGVPSEGIPAQAQAQAALYRSLLADKRVLIIADNARDEQQVRPLLPASAGSLVLVTSRNQLSGLAAADGARLLTLDVLSHAEAVQLLGVRLGAARVATDPEAIGEMASLCACLPLALSVATARAAARPEFPLAALASELRDSAGRLDALDNGDPSTSIRAVFSWSFRQLSAGAARMFRLLGLHPGPDISVPAAVSLAGVDETEARRALSELTRAHLIVEHAPGRFTFHDLLRAFAAAQVRRSESVLERKAAVGRVLDHYLHTARSATSSLYPAHEPVAIAPSSPGTIPEQLTGYGQILDWFEQEHQVLFAAVMLAANSGFDAHAWQIPWAMHSFLCFRGYWPGWATLQRTALAAAARSHDIGGQAVSSRLLALACLELGHYDEALRYYDKSLMLYRQLGNQLGEAKVQQNLGVLAEREGRHADALARGEHSLRLYRAIGDRAAEAEALIDVAWYNGLLGSCRRAQELCREGLMLNAEVRDHRLEGCAWDSLGYAELRLGNVSEALACYQRAISIARESGDRRNEGSRTTRLGDAYHAAGDLPKARDAWQRALVILEDLHRPGAAEVHAKLSRVESPRTFGADI